MYPLYNPAAMRRRIRGILMSGKQFSLDSRMDLVQGFKPISDSECPGTVEEELEPGNFASSTDKPKYGVG